MHPASMKDLQDEEDRLEEEVERNLEQPKTGDGGDGKRQPVPSKKRLLMEMQHSKAAKCVKVPYACHTLYLYIEYD